MSVRLSEIAAILLIGDGAVGALLPARHAARWVQGPVWWRRSMRLFAERPELTRASALVELGLGVWWAARLPARTS